MSSPDPSADYVRAATLLGEKVRALREARGLTQEQLADLMAFIDRTGGDAPRIVAGDFNIAAGRPELATLDVAGFEEAFTRLHPRDPRPTLNPHYFPDNARRIDQVYLQRDRLVALEARIVLDREGAPGTWPSDHFGLYVRAAFGPTR